MLQLLGNTCVYTSLQLQVVSFLRLTTLKADSPIDIKYMRTSTPYPITQHCKIHGIIGKNIVDFIAVTALK